jgi:hypothetical protein
MRSPLALEPRKTTPFHDLDGLLPSFGIAFLIISSFLEILFFIYTSYVLPLPSLIRKIIISSKGNTTSASAFGNSIIIGIISLHSSSWNYSQNTVSLRTLCLSLSDILERFMVYIFYFWNFFFMGTSVLNPLTLLEHSYRSVWSYNSNSGINSHYISSFAFVTLLPLVLLLHGHPLRSFLVSFARVDKRPSRNQHHDDGVQHDPSTEL